MQGTGYTNYEGQDPNFNHEIAGPGITEGGISIVGVHRGVVNDVANYDHGAMEAEKGRGGKLRNKLHPTHGHHEEAGLGTDLGANGLVDRSKFTGHGPVDQLDQKLADRNLIDNSVAGARGDLYGIGGFPAVESFRQDPDGVLRHKFTGQTHFDSETPFTGPGFTNGDLYDKPGFAGTKSGQSGAQGPIKALAQKIVGQKYTTHEPLMDKIYVEPHQKGPIDTLAHMIVGGSGVHPTQTDLTGAGMDQDHVVHRGLLHKVKDVFHHKSTPSDLVNKEKAEGPIDALAHKLTLSLHDPVHHKGGVGAQHDGVLGGANTVPLTENFADNHGASVEKHGLMGKIMNKLHHHHADPMADKGFAESNQFGAR